MPRLPSPFNKHGAPASSIPMPASAPRRPAGQLVAPAPILQGGGKPMSASSSRSTSPSQPPHSFIPTPRPPARASLNEKHLPTNSARSSTPSSNGSRSSLRAPSVPTASPYGTQVPPPKNAMLDKLKIFNSKDKVDRVKGGGNVLVSKRTSSSSGFSSARSEQSDSSTSLCSDANAKLVTGQMVPVPLEKGGNVPVVSSNLSPSDGSSPKSLSRGLRNKLVKTSGNAKEVKQNSPKGSRKSETNKPSPKLIQKTGSINCGVGKENRERTECDVKSRDERTKMNGDIDSKVNNRTERVNADEYLYAPALEVDNPIKQSKISNLNSKTEQNNLKTENNNVVAETVKLKPEPLIPKLEQNNIRTEQINQGLVRTQQTHINSKVDQINPKTEHQTNNMKQEQTTKVSHVNGKPEKIEHVPQRPENINVKPKLKPVEGIRSPPATLNNAGTGIPKPMAAIKGTSKPSKEERPVISPIKHSVPKLSSNDALRQKQPVWEDGNVALVSPMPNISSSESSGSKLSESSNSNSNSGGHSNSSDSSVIYKPSSESGSELGKPVNKKIETTFDRLDKVITHQRQQSKETTFGEEEDTVMNVKPMQPLLRGYTGGLGMPRRTLTPSMHHLGYSHHGSSIKCLNYTPDYMTLDIKRGMGDGRYDGDYSDIEIASGYLSDGDMMRIGISRPLQDLCDGYMSEGGASLYARKIQQAQQMIYHDSRFPNSATSSEVSSSGDAPSRRPSAKPRVAPQRFDDTSSVSSGVSESIADYYGDEHLPGQQHKRLIQSNRPGGCNKNQVKTLTPPFSPSDLPPVVYRVVGTRSHTKKSDSSQQTDYSAFRQISNTQWKKYVEGGRPPELQRGKSDLEVVRPRDREKRNTGSSPSSSSSSNGPIRRTEKTSEKHKKMGVKDDLAAKEREYCNGEKQPKTDRSSPHNPANMRSNGEGKSSKVRGVPQSFGYVKRPTNGCTTNGNKTGETRTAQVSAVPRTKVKVSGGTQTCNSDLPHFKSFSLTGPSASQLSQSVRDRLLLGSQSLPKSSPPRPPHKPTDGSLSDTAYSNYAEIQGYYGASSPYSSWLRHSSTYTASLPARTSAAGLVEADSVESLCSLPAQLQHRASLTHARLLMHQRDSSASPVPRLNRSNSIRSTKSEKLYPSMLQRSEELDPYYGIPLSASSMSHASQPTSPTPSQISQGAPSRFNYPMSPITSSASSHVLSRTNMSPYSGLLSKTNSKDDEVHGSSASLVSTASSLYSTPEEKQAHEIRKLRRELQDAQEKVHTLTSQLSTNAHVVSAFEQSLSNMTQRLQHLTSTAERKDSELLELRQTIELLRKQSVEAGLTSAHLQNMSPSLARRHTINTTATVNGGNISRQLSADSVSSINSLSSACSLSSSAHANESSGKKKKKGWLRSSFSKAFSRSKKNKNGSVSDVEDSRGIHSDVSAPSSPLLNDPHQMNGGQNIKSSHSSSAICGDKTTEPIGNDVVEELKKQLREKDLVLTDIRLEALSSAHQLESLKDTVIKMRNEMINLKQDNERLQRIVTSKSLTSSQSSLPITDSLERRFSLTEMTTMQPSENDILQICNWEPSQNILSDPDGKRVFVSVLLGSHGSYHKYMEEGNNPAECVIAALSVNGKMKWDMLDCMIRRVFKEYVLRVDPVSNLGLSAESVWSYHVGEVVRYKDSELPELLPYGYVVGNTKSIHICLKGAMHNGSVDALAFETLIPKSIVQRYVSLLTEHRRIILCGPSGTGKSYLANKLAEFLVLREGKDSTAESIATFNVDHKSSKELRQYLANVAEQCENNASDLPSVIILDNLHHAASLGEVFNGFLNAKYSKCPYIIGTMNQATCSTTNLQLHHNFRWVLCANHMEPVKGFLGRYLRRRLLEVEVQEGVRNNDLTRILDWIPKVWQHLNKFLETHSSSDVTIGPRLFLSCPSDLAGSQIWFTDLWNYSVVPYLLEAVREGLQLYGRRAPWEDPTQFICQTYPWTGEVVQGGQDALLRLRPEDVGYDIQQSSGIGGSSIKSMSSTQSDTEGDPLLNMLMRLQEAANYSSPHSNDSDSLSIDSHSSSIHAEEKGVPRVESTL